MRITVNIDDELYERALELTGQDIATEPEALFREALQTFVQVQAAKRLAALGGTMPEMETTSYEQDVNAWACEQAHRIRTGRFDQLDIGHIAGEIEDVGKGELRELARCMAVLLEHLLKWAYLPARRSTGWEKVILAQRKEIRYLLGESPSLAPKMQEPLWIDMVWTRAVANVVTETGLDGFPEDCPWDLQGQVLWGTWLPPE